jgi:transcriptional regulator with XRE-family HTH domain
MVAIINTVKCKMLTNMEDFVTWVQKEMETRGLSMRAIGRRTGVSHATISTVLSGKQPPSPELCNGLARVFEVLPDWVFRRAGLLPPLPGTEDDLALREINEIAKNLSLEERREAREYLLWRYRSSRE